MESEHKEDRNCQETQNGSERQGSGWQGEKQNAYSKKENEPGKDQFSSNLSVFLPGPPTPAMPPSRRFPVVHLTTSFCVFRCHSLFAEGSAAGFGSRLLVGFVGSNDPLHQFVADDILLSQVDEFDALHLLQNGLDLDEA